MSEVSVSEQTCDEQFSEQAIKLIVARLEVAPHDVFLVSGGSDKPISRDDMIKHVRDCDEIGKEYMAIQFEFFKAIRDGRLRQILTPKAPPV